MKMHQTGQVKGIVIGKFNERFSYRSTWRHGDICYCSFFQQYADVFEAKKEFDRPRIIIDNRCTMPSRVRAFCIMKK